MEMTRACICTIPLSDGRGACSASGLVSVTADPRIAAFFANVCLNHSPRTAGQKEAPITCLLKRVSPLCHSWLGATLGLAPLAGWIAVEPTSMSLAPVLLFFAVTFWVGAFDIYYAFQDLGCDLAQGLHSIPACYGPKTALALAGFSHVMTVMMWEKPASARAVCGPKQAGMEWSPWARSQSRS